MISLRDYQQVSIDRVRHAFAVGKQRVLLASPTGSGKTISFAYICENAAKRNHPVLVLAHRVELIDQISEALRDFSVPHGFIAAGYSTARRLVMVGNVHTVIRRLDDIAEPALIIVDEAHHCAGTNTWSKILARFPRAKVLGVTATPIRLDGHGLGQTFEWIINGPTTEDLIAAGYLAKLRVFAPPTVNTHQLHRRFGEYIRGEVEALLDKPTIVGDCIEHYLKHASGQRAIVFCVSVAHARAVAAGFSDRAIPSACLDGSLPREVRRDLVARFRLEHGRAGAITVLTSCDVVSEGFDLPAIECGIMLRPTASTALHLQQIGRCLRPAPGKSHALILDHVGNTLRHGLPTDYQEWTLEEGTVQSSRKPSSGVRICPKCWAANTLRTRVCSVCQHAWPVESREVKAIAGELAEITPEQYRKKLSRMDQGQTQTLADLIALGRRRGYKSPEAWASYVIKGREAKRRA